MTTVDILKLNNRKISFHTNSFLVGFQTRSSGSKKCWCNSLLHSAIWYSFLTKLFYFSRNQFYRFKISRDKDSHRCVCETERTRLFN